MSAEKIETAETVESVNNDNASLTAGGHDDAFSTVIEDQSASFPDVTASYAAKIDAEIEAADRREHNLRRRRDSSGVYFDPELHQVDEDGEPKKTIKGLWVMRRGKKRSAGKKRLRLPRNTAADDSGDKKSDSHEDDCTGDMYIVAAEQTAGAFWAAMMAVFGADGAPDATEAAQLPPALEAYYRSTGRVPQMPLWLPPVIIAGNAVNKRLQADDQRRSQLKTLAVAAYKKIGGVLRRCTR